MNLDIGRVLSRSFSISWRHRWLWLLGVFGGVGVGGRVNFPTSFSGSTPTPGAEAFTRFMADYFGLLLAALVVLVVLGVVAFVISCIAVPASIWAALQLDAGRDVGLRLAWREGRKRGWRYFRLVLLKFLISLGLLSVLALAVIVGIMVYAAGGSGTIPLLVLGGIALVLAFVAGLVVLALGLAWSERMLVILGVSARDSIRASWWLFRHNKLTTILFAVALYVIQLGITLGVGLAALVVAAPGIVMLVIFFTSSGAPVLAILGVSWVVLLGGAVLLVGIGYLGALVQVAYALAARDLSLRAGFQVLPEVTSWTPG